MRFEWDAEKAAANWAKHGVAFEEVLGVFGDAFEITIADPTHPHGEARFVSIGRTEAGRLFVVAYVERGDVIRIVSARQATPKERRHYESTERS